MFNDVDKQYLDLCKDILDNGTSVSNRTGFDTKRVFSRQLRVDLQKGFPLLTTKKMFWKNIIGEVLWFFNGDNCLPSLRKYQCKEEGANTIWSADYQKYKDRLISAGVRQVYSESLGNIYGTQIRSYNGIDQLNLLIKNIKEVMKDPTHSMARRLKCEFWNPEDHLDSEGLKAALPACHTGFICMVEGNKLNMKFYMRSNDVFLGLPYNLASYATMCHIIAKLTGLQVGELVYDGADVHIYHNHIEQIKIQIEREPYESPQLILPDINSLEDLTSLTANDFKVNNYKYHSFIKGVQAS